MWGRAPGEKSQLPRHPELSWPGAHAVALGNVLKLPETFNKGLGPCVRRGGRQVSETSYYCCNLTGPKDRWGLWKFRLFILRKKKQRARGKKRVVRWWRIKYKLPDTLSVSLRSLSNNIFCKSDTTQGLNNTNVETDRQPLFIHAVHRGCAMGMCTTTRALKSSRKISYQNGAIPLSIKHSCNKCWQRFASLSLQCACL